ncbi:MAG: T9SS type A sorting domain-containing protein [Candidatus Zixiibacteriota bacterium]|nr:MAG: T9SS type A sorting domain-containing protein [candidate division Zixibacteria bacterium]
MGLDRNYYFVGRFFVVLVTCLTLYAGPAFSQVMSLVPASQLDRCTDVDTLWIYGDADILDVKAFDIKIGFDSTYVTAGSVFKGSGLDSDDFLASAIDNPNDSLLINIAILGSGDVFNGPDTVVGIIFTTENENASAAITFTRSELRDTLNQSISHSTTGATLEIDCTPPAVPTLISPTDGSYTSNTTPELNWDPATDAVSYTLEYADNSGFSPSTVVSGLTDTNYAMPTLAEGAWYWHVKAIDLATNESAYSSDWSFTVDTTPPAVPTLAAPANGGSINDNTPALHWHPATGADTYTLEYADNPGFTGAVEVADLSDTTYTMPTLTDGDWYWHVKAIDQALNESAYSTAWSFTLDTVPPGTPTLASPADGSYTNDDTPELNWNPSSGANTYTLEYADNAGFSGAVEVPGLSDTTYTMPALDDGDWYWHVKAVDEALNESAYSTAWSFTVDTAVPSAPTGLTAVPGHNSISLTWTNEPTDFHHTVIMRSDWYAGGHDYPEYDIAEGAYPSDTVSFDLAYSGTGTSHIDTDDISNTTRDIYHYAAFTVDNAGNMSAPSTGTRATSYWLGDVAGGGGLNDYDGYVYFEDLMILSNCYWTFHGDLNYEPQFDIGPTDNGSPTGIPTTDDVINFEDLAIFACNFDTVSPSPRIVPLLSGLNNNGPLGLSLEATSELIIGEEFTVEVRLMNNPGIVKGIHFTIPYDSDKLEFVNITQSEELSNSASPVFFDGREINGAIDVSLALLGGNSVIGGSGGIAELTFRLLELENLSLSFETIELRDGENINLPAIGKGWEHSLIPELPTSYGLSQSYPNPFNLQARISYQVPEPGFVNILIYNIQGQVVRTLVEEYKPAGYHSETWDGRNDAGEVIASGIYTYRMEANGFNATRKMLLIK